MNPLRVNFGCGENRLDGWENWDAEVDVCKPLPYLYNSVDEILIEHCLEHISGPDMFRFLIEARCALKPGGILHVSMPVLDRLEPDHARDIILGHGHMTAWTQDSLTLVCNLSGYRDIVKDTNQDGSRPAIYGHHKIIGESKDELESFRLRLIK